MEKGNKGEGYSTLFNYLYLIYANYINMYSENTDIGTRGGHKISDSGETHRNEYLLCKNFKTGFGFFVPRTVFSSHSGPASL